MTDIDTETKWVTCKSCEGLGEVDPSEKLDVDDLDALRKELTETVTMDSGSTGLLSTRRGERIRTTARIAWLASRIGWLEACEVSRADDEIRYAQMAKASAEKRAAAERAAWEAEHEGPDGDYFALDGDRAVKRSEYDPAVHGPAMIRVDGQLLVNQAAIEEAHRVVAAKVASGELIRLASGGFSAADEYDPEKHGPITTKEN